MARSTYFDLGRSADACPGSVSGYAQRFQCGNVVKRLIWTGMSPPVPEVIDELALCNDTWITEYAFHLLKAQTQAQSTRC